MNYSGLLFFTGQQLFHDILILAWGENDGGSSYNPCTSSLGSVIVRLLSYQMRVEPST